MTHPAIFSSNIYLFIYFMMLQWMYKKKTAGRRVTLLYKTTTLFQKILLGFLSAALGLLCLKQLCAGSFSCC